MVKNGNFTLLLQLVWRMVSVHVYWHLVGQDWQFHYCFWHLVGQEWQFHIANDISVVRNGNWILLLTSSSQSMAISTWLHLEIAVKNANCTCLLISNGQEWSIAHCLLHTLVVKNGNFTCTNWHLVVRNDYFSLLLTSSSQEWQFHIATDI